MGFYRGFSELIRGGVLLVYYYAEKGSGRIRKNTFDEYFAGYPYIYMLYINVNQSSDEQVKTFIHECIHLSPEFFSRIGDLDIESLEEEIEDLTEQTFTNQPNLVERIRNSVATEDTAAELFRREKIKEVELRSVKGIIEPYRIYRIIPKRVR